MLNTEHISKTLTGIAVDLDPLGPFGLLESVRPVVLFEPLGPLLLVEPTRPLVLFTPLGPLGPFVLQLDAPMSLH